MRTLIVNNVTRNAVLDLVVGILGTHSDVCRGGEDALPVISLSMLHTEHVVALSAMQRCASRVAVGPAPVPCAGCVCSTAVVAHTVEVQKNFSVGTKEPPQCSGGPHSKIAPVITLVACDETVVASIGGVHLTFCATQARLRRSLHVAAYLLDANYHHSFGFYRILRSLFTSEPLLVHCMC